MIEEEQGKEDQATSDYEQACTYGNPDAPYRAAGRYVVDRERLDLEKAQHYYLMGAELGDWTSMDMLSPGLRAKHLKTEEHYWFLLYHMGEKDSIKMSRFIDYYHHILNDKDRFFLDSVIRVKAISGGQVQGNGSLPGRSTLTAAYVDFCLRRMLGFMWLAFFDATGKRKPFPMATVYKGFKKDYERNNPLVSVYLEGNNRYASLPESIQMPAAKLVASLLPGDEILVNCGGLSHYAIIWSTNRTNKYGSPAGPLL